MSGALPPPKKQNPAGKVERLTIHNGTTGLMNDLVKLRDEA